MNYSTLVYPSCIIVALIAGLSFPEWLSQGKPLITSLLICIMFTMGLTLENKHLLQAWTKPLPIFFGVTLQFLIMPVSAYCLGMTFQVEKSVLIGLVLVGCAPGGTASNVVTYLAGGNVALSISMTVLSTLIAIAFTPLLVGFLLDEVVAVDRLALFNSLIKISIIPLALGIIVNHFAASQIKAFEKTLPAFALLSISVIAAIIVALNQPLMLTLGLMLFCIISSFILIGFTLGFLGSKCLGLSTKDAKTIAIEIGMQNSGLASVLAIKHFGIASALAPTVFSVLQNTYAMAIFPLYKRSPKKQPSSELT